MTNLTTYVIFSGQRFAILAIFCVKRSHDLLCDDVFSKEKKFSGENSFLVKKVILLITVTTVTTVTTLQ